jgi:hypothetical protein
LGFLNPAFLFGIVAAVIPLLIHLWHRRQVKTVDFSSLMFLILAHKQTARRIHLYNILLLLLRMAIITLIALALSRPLLKNNLFFVGHRAKTSCVIILDNSYSMGYQDISGQRFELARNKATEVLSSLQSGDQSALILMSDIADPVIRKLTPDLDLVRTAIRQAKLTYRGTNIVASVNLAHEILTGADNLNQEIYLITDLAGWKGTTPIPNRSGAKIFILPIGDQVAENAGITSIQASRPLIGTHLPVQIEVEIGNYTNAPLNQTLVQVFFNDLKRRSIQLPAQLETDLSVSFSHQFQTVGSHIGHLQLPMDRLEADNRRYFVFEAYGGIKTLCVTDAPFYLLAALNPSSSAGDQAGLDPSFQTSATISPGAISPSEISTVSVEDWDILLLSDLETFSSNTIQQIQAFLRAGKSLILFAGMDLVKPVQTNQNLRDWLGITLGENVIWNPPTQITLSDPQHVIFDPFEETAFIGDSAPRFFRGLEMSVESTAKVLAQFQNQIPFLVEYRIENGTVLIFNASGKTLTDADLLVTPYFLPLLQQSVLYAKSRQVAMNRQLTVGQPLSIHLRELVDRVEIGPPDGQPSKSIQLDQDRHIAFAGTDQPGIYQIDIYGNEDKQRQFLAVNLDSSESDLRPINLERAGVLLSAHTVDSQEELDQKLNTLRTGREIWGELLVLALALMGIESLVANRNQKG